MSLVFAPVTENPTVQHILKVPQEASREVHDGDIWSIGGHESLFIVWQNPLMFSNFIVRRGSFRLLSAFMCAVGKMMR